MQAVLCSDGDSGRNAIAVLISAYVKRKLRKCLAEKNKKLIFVGKM